MDPHRSTGSRSSQRGAALLIFALLLIIGLLGALFTRLNSTTQAILHTQATQDALAQAKEALLAYASTQDRPGVLPCPDTNNDGSGNPNGDLGCYSRIGRLPWKQLKLPDLRDGNGERLWYAVSAEFANVPSAQVVNNEESTGLINLCGSAGCGDASPIPIPSATAPYPTANLAAIVFSAGVPLSGNNRQDGVDTNPDPATNIDPAKKALNYLDSATLDSKIFSNSSGSSNGNDFVAANHSSTFNDLLLPISAGEVFANVNKRMENKATLTEIAKCIAEYGMNNNTPSDHRLPWSAPLGIDVSDATKFDDSAGLKSGRLPYYLADSTNQTPAHNWSTTAIPPATRNTLGACSTLPKWWGSWKSYIFYAVASNFSPDFDGGLAPSPNSCFAPSGCLSVNGGVRKFAAVVIFSGRKLASQLRTSLAEKQDKNNYLEGANLSSIGGIGTDFTNNSVSTTFNDTIVCINNDLSISPDCS